MNRILLFLLLGVLFGGCQQGPVYKLRLRYQQGETFNIDYHTYAGTQNQKGLVNQQIKMRFRVDSITHDSLYILSARVTSLRMYDSGPLGEKYSSEKDTADMSATEKELHASFKSVLDATYQLTINNRGEIIAPFSIKGVKSTRRVSSPIDFENCQVPFPDEPIAIGESWTRERNIPLIGAKRTSTYTLAGIKNSAIRIEVSGVIELPGDLGENEFSGKYTLHEGNKVLIVADIETEMQSFNGSGKTRLYIRQR